MKSAQEWLDTEQWHESGDNAILPQIAAIQIDALSMAVQFVEMYSQYRDGAQITAKELRLIIQVIETKYKLK